MITEDSGSFTVFNKIRDVFAGRISTADKTLYITMTLIKVAAQYRLLHTICSVSELFLLGVR